MILTDTIYLDVNDKIEKYVELLNTNQHLAIFMGDFKRGIQFQQRLILDCYVLLTTPKERLIINSYKSFQHPVNAFLNDLLISQTDIERYKRMNRHQLQVSLVVSIFLVKKIIYEMDSNSLYFGDFLSIQNALETNHEIDTKSIVTLHANIISKLKQLNVSNKLAIILEEAIQEAKQLVQLLGED